MNLIKMEEDFLTIPDTNHYDIDSLCDSDREELEHALYSQIHYDTGDRHVDYTDYSYNSGFISNSTPQKINENSQIENNDSGIKTETIPKHVEAANISMLNHSEKRCKNTPKSSDEKRNVSSNLKSKQLKQKLNISAVNINHKNLKSSNLKKVDLRKKMSEEDEKEESKYKCRLQNKTKPSYIAPSTINSDKEDKSSVITISDSDNSSILKKVDLRKKKPEEDEKDESKDKCRLQKKTKPSDIVPITINSDEEDSDNSSVLTISDSDHSSVLTITDSEMSDSDSSSMCSKIFTKDSKLSDIQLNIDNNSDNRDEDIDDILSVSDHTSSDEENEDDKWRVSEQDILGAQPEVFRYYKYDAVKHVRCKNCREKGHLSRDCPKPKIIVCYLCGQRDHISTACPEPLCYNCSNPGHMASDCTQPQYKWYIKCSRCDMPGHQHEDCPDNWRRYHVTTEGEPKQSKVKINPRKFCCNCGSYKHFGYKCNKPPMSSHAQITYPFIVSYKPPVPKKHKISTKKYFDDDEEILQPVFKKKKIQLVGFDAKQKKDNILKIKPMKTVKKSQDPLKNFKKVMKDYKSVKDKNNKKKQKGQKLKNIQEKSAFVKSAKKANLDDKLYLYTDKQMNRKNKAKSKKKFEKQGKKQKTKKGRKVN